MKKLLFKILTITFALTLLLGVSSSCGKENAEIIEDFDFRPITLNGQEGYALVGINNTENKNIVIPETYYNKPILSINISEPSGADVIESFEIPSNIIRIEDNSFYNFTALECLSFHKNSKLEYIGESVFRGCTRLNKLEIPNSVKIIGRTAFGNCRALTNIDLPNNLENIEDEVFFDCNALKSVEIPNNVQSIGEDAFKDCKSLIIVEFEENSKLTDINKNAFYNCSALSYIEIPNSIESIHEESFIKCNSLIYNVINGLKYLGNHNNKYLYLMETDGVGTTATIQDGCKCIGTNAFKSCWNLESVTIPNTVSIISDSAFDNCRKLNDIELPDSVKYIGSSAFNMCYKLKKINIPNNIEYIGRGAFTLCNSLLYNVEGGLKYLGNDNNKYLLLIGVESEDITSAVINENCKIIGACEWGWCRGLSKITIPSSVCYINDDTFNFNIELVIYCEAKTKPSKWSNNWNSSNTVVWDCINNNVANDGCIYVEEDGLRYKIKDNEAILTQQAHNIIEANIKPVIVYNGKPYAVTSIEGFAFSGCQSLKNVIIPRSINSIGIEAFSFCNALEKIIIPSSVISIESLAFMDSSSLIIYCEVSRKPDGWDERWSDSLNIPNRPVVWGYKEN